MNNLASLYVEQGDYEGAEPLLVEALDLNQNIYGEDHPDVVTSISNLATLYQRQGRYTEAELLYVRVLALRRKTLGDSHTLVAAGLNNLAFLYRAQGRYSEAEPLFEKALELNRVALGGNHPELALSMNNLALVYNAQGRYTEAESLYLKALELNQTVLGDIHPRVATSFNNLALLNMDAGRYVRAESFIKKAMDIHQQVLGVQHPDMANYMNSLGSLYQRQGRFEEADTLYREALNLRLKILGENHPEVAISFNNLGYLFFSQGRYNEARALYEQALGLYHRTLGESHPNVVSSLFNLALLDVALQKPAEAYQLFHNVLQWNIRFMRDELAFATELEKQRFLRIQGSYSPLLTLTKPTDEVSSRTTFDLILQRKGIQLDLATQQRQRIGEDPVAHRLFSEATRLSRQISNLTFSPRVDIGTKFYRQRLDSLYRVRESKEDSLVRLSGDFIQKKNVQQATLQSLVEAMPAKGTFVEYVRYRPYDFEAMVNANSRKPARYVAFTLKGEHVSMFDLGPAEPIDSLLAEYRSEVRDFEPSAGRQAKEASLDRVCRCCSNST